ncbi:MAG: hypothetical protein ABIH99_03480 [Candidatus Micrarchaeota archaeon]
MAGKLKGDLDLTIRDFDITALLLGTTIEALVYRGVRVALDEMKDEKLVGLLKNVRSSEIVVIVRAANKDQIKRMCKLARQNGIRRQINVASSTGGCAVESGGMSPKTRKRIKYFDMNDIGEIGSSGAAFRRTADNKRVKEQIERKMPVAQKK